MSTLSRWPSSFLVLATLVAATGCGTALTIEVRGIAPLNQTDNDESTPVNARIYQLASDAKFRNAVIASAAPRW